MNKHAEHLPAAPAAQSRSLRQALQTAAREALDATARPNVIPFPSAGGRAEAAQGQAAEFACALLLFRLAEHRALGETFGDYLAQELSRSVAARLRSCLRRDDGLEQISEDEFAIALDQPGSADDVARITERLMRHGGGSYVLNGMQLRVRAAVGIATAREVPEATGELVRHARIALRHAESDRAASGYHFFSQELLERQSERLRMAVEIEQALAEGRMRLHYQPQYALDSRRIVGMEALVRMESHTGELVPPDRFIPLAEDNGMIVPLGHWVIREACRQMRRWRDAGCAPLRMGVNVSPRQLHDEGLVAVIDEAVAESGLQYGELEIEITERCIVERLPVVEGVLRALSERGVRVAVDDFGAGFSSFAYLAQLPVTMVKMDRSFLRAVPEDARAGRTLAAMVAMARELELEITAEGVETEAQDAFLRAAACTLGQGFGLARPQPAEAITALLQAQG